MVAARRYRPVILGGIGFAGMAERIAGKVPVPLVDNVVAAVQMAEAAAALRFAKPRGRARSED
jgi:allantoin racemase